jgi:hypothetical protein
LQSVLECGREWLARISFDDGGGWRDTRAYPLL